ncbi:MAG: hypothetical protein ROO76_06460 [Terriglobia bacterium]|nr:hypothetical protein [Terriglobia bacterium]
MRYQLAVVIFFILFPLIPSALAQDLPVPDPEVVHPNLRVTITMPSVKATDQGKTAIVKAAVAMVLGAADLKCDPGSQLNAVLEANAASPLRTLSEKIAGASCAIDGHANQLNATFTPQWRNPG